MEKVFHRRPIRVMSLAQQNNGNAQSLFGKSVVRVGAVTNPKDEPKREYAEAFGQSDDGKHSL
jgi:hypothetical protein